MTSVKKQGMTKSIPCYLLILITLLILLFLSIIVAVSIGTMSIPIEKVYRVVLFEIFNIGDPEIWGSGGVHDVVWLIRMPRLILATAVGMALAVCGVVMQAIVKNPLADPYILGVSSGAYLGATLAVGLGLQMAWGGSAMGLFGCIGAFVVSILVVTIANMGGRANAVKLILAGMAISAICSAFSNFFVYMLDDSATTSIVHWSMGSLAGAAWDNAILILCVTVIGSLFFWTQYRNLNLMLLGDDSAKTLGSDLHVWRLLYLLVSSLMVGFAVYKAGMIGFVGMVIPHAVRMIFGTNHKKLIPLAALSGAIFLVWADVFCRIVLPHNELPIGILTALIGAPVFIYLMIRKRYGFGGASK